MMNDSTPCTICQGAFSEHGEGKTIHAYTTKAGELVTEQDRNKQEVKAQAQVLRLPAAQGNDIGRLLEVLMYKRVLDPLDSLYILGAGQRPEGVVPNGNGS